MTGARARWIAVAAALAGFGATALLWTWPLPLHWGSTLAGSTGDPLLLLWTLSWDVHALRHGLPLFDANIFHPCPLALAFSDHLLGEAPLFAAARALGCNPIAAYNVTVVTCVALNGFGAWLLARELTGRERGAILAGVVYAFAPWRLAHLDHLAFQATAGYPLALWCWVRATSSRPAAWYAAMAAVLAWQALCGGYHAVYVAMLFPLLGLLHVLHRRRPAAVTGPLAATMTALLAISPTLLPYLRMRATMGQISGAHPEWGTSLLSAITAPRADRLWGWTAALWGQTMNGEGMLFPGMVAIVLATAGLRRVIRWDLAADREARTPWGLRVLDAILVLLALWIAWIQASGGGTFHLGPLVVGARGTSAPLSIALLLALLRVALDPVLRRRIASAFRASAPAPALLAALAVVAAILSFYGPSALLGRIVPGLGSLRVPARLYLLVLLSLSMFAAWGLASLPVDGLAAATIVGLALLEGSAVPMPLGQAPEPNLPLPPPAALRSAPGDVYRWLADQPRAAMVELPSPTASYDLFYEMASTMHWQPVVNGSSGYSPRYYDALRETLAGFPDDDALDALGDLGVTRVVYHCAYVATERRAAIAAAIARQPRLTPLARFGDDAVYGLTSALHADPPEPAVSDEIPRDAWRVTACGDPNPLGTIRGMRDGDPHTRWCMERSQAAGDWMAVDMGDAVDVAALRLELGAHASDYPRRFRVETSLDGQRWETAARRAVGRPPLRAALAQPLNPWITVTFPPRRARHFRVILEAGDRAFWCVAEIRAFTRPAIGDRYELPR